MGTNLLGSLLGATTGLGGTGGGGGAAQKKVNLPAYTTLPGSIAAGGLTVFLDDPPGEGGNSWQLRGNQPTTEVGSFALIPNAPGSNSGLLITLGDPLGDPGNEWVLNAVARVDGSVYYIRRLDTPKQVVFSYNPTIDYTLLIADDGNVNGIYLLLPSVLATAANDDGITPTLLVEDSVIIDPAVRAHWDIYADDTGTSGLRVSREQGGVGGNNWTGNITYNAGPGFTIDDGNNLITIAITAATLATYTLGIIYDTFRFRDDFRAEYFGGEDGSSTPFNDYTAAELNSDNQSFSGGADAGLVPGLRYIGQNYQYVYSAANKTLLELNTLWSAAALYDEYTITGAVTSGTIANGIYEFNNSPPLHKLREVLNFLTNVNSAYIGNEIGVSKPFRDNTPAELGFTGESIVVSSNLLAQATKQFAGGNAGGLRVNVDSVAEIIDVFYTTVVSTDFPSLDTLGTIKAIIDAEDRLSSEYRGTDTTASLPATSVDYTNDFAGGITDTIDLGGFALGPPTNRFGTFTGTKAAAIVLRDAYATTNPNWEPAYRGKFECLIALQHTGGITLQTLPAVGTWRDVDMAIAGNDGSRGPAGAPGGGAIENFGITLDGTGARATNIFIATGVMLGERGDTPYIGYRLNSNTLALLWFTTDKLYNIEVASAGDTSTDGSTTIERNRLTLPESAGSSIAGSIYAGITAANELLLATSSSNVDFTAEFFRYITSEQQAASGGTDEARVQELINATNLSALQGQVTDSQIPDAIMRDAELTAAAVRNLLGLTSTEVNNLLTGSTLNTITDPNDGSISYRLVFTENDGTVTTINLPFTTGSAAADGVVASGAFSTDNQTLTLTLDTGGTIDIDVPSALRTDNYIVGGSIDNAGEILTLSRIFGTSIEVSIPSILRSAPGAGQTADQVMALVRAGIEAAVSNNTETGIDVTWNDDGTLDFVVSSSGQPVVMDDIYFGTSVDDTAESAEFTIAAVSGVGTIPAYTGNRHHLIARLASEDDIVSVTYSNDPTMLNSVGGFTKQAGTIMPPGETEEFSVWISNHALTNAADVEITVN